MRMVLILVLLMIKTHLKTNKTHVAKESQEARSTENTRGAGSQKRNRSHQKAREAKQ